MRMLFRPHAPNDLRRAWTLLLNLAVIGGVTCSSVTFATYTGSVAGPTSPTISSAGSEILANGGGGGLFTYKGGGNAIDAAVATALTACIVSPQACSLGGYGGHMLIYKAGWDGGPRLITCIDFNSTAGSLASADMFVGNVDLTNGHWTGPLPAASQFGWKAIGVPGTLAGLYMAQTNYGRKISGTNYFPFAEIMKPILSRVANGQVAANAYYSVASVSNLLMELYTNSPGYLDTNGDPNPNSTHDPCAVFYSGAIALDIVAAMQANGGLVTYADMTNYRPLEVVPYMQHFACPNGTPATVYVAPPGSAGLSVLQQLAMIEALGWTNGPTGTWDSVHYWHSRAEIARLMWKDHYQWLGDPWSGIVPPDFLGNGSTNFCAQMLAHATNGYPQGCPWDPNELPLTNSQAASIAQAVNNQTNISIAVDWEDIRYGTFHISTSDRWGNCVSVTLSMGGGFGAQVGLTNRGLVFGQGMALFDARPGWPDSIGPGKRPVDNMCPVIVVPDSPVSPTNGAIGGRPPFAVGGGGGSTIENNRAMQLVKYLMDPPSSPVVDPSVWLYNYEANKTIYMRPSYPAGVQSYLTSVGFTAPGSPPSTGDYSYVQAWIPPVITAEPASTNLNNGSTATFVVQATGLPLFYQWFRDGAPLTNSGAISGAQTPQLTVSGVSTGAAYAVVITNGGASVTSAPAALTINGQPVLLTQPASTTNVIGSFATLNVSAAGNAPLFYQWRKNGANVVDGTNTSGATTPQLTIGPLTSADAAIYSVVVTNASGSDTSVDAILSVVLPEPYLAPLWNVSSTDAEPWFNISANTSVPNQRTIAYNSLSNHLYIISRSSNLTSNYVLYVLNATNGTFLYTLKTNGIQSNVGTRGIGLVGIAVADDGAIYACNMAPDASGVAGTDPTSLFRMYRWANGGGNTIPTLIFSGDPTGTTSPLRWGDNLTVRGTGTNTQILVDMTYFGATAGTNGFAAVLSPSNAFMTNFVARWFTTTNFATTVGRSLEFEGTNNAIWQKAAGAALFKIAFNPNVNLGGKRISSTNIYATSGFPPALMGVGLDANRPLGAGVVSSTGTADTLDLYEVSDLNAPRLLSKYDFPITPRVANGNRISQTFFKNELVFSIDANNGIVVLEVKNPPAIVSITELQRLPSGAFRLGYSNLIGGPYAVYASTNLLDWEPLGLSTQATHGFYEFTDFTSTNVPHRFYRLQWP
jgi:gamma-glutamyltranspeptidase